MHSIIQNSKECFVTKERNVQLHKHHCLNGVGLRDFAEKNGLWVYLSWNIHDELHNGNNELAVELKRIAQHFYELTHTRDEWMKNVHKNYLVLPLSDEEMNKYQINSCVELNLLDDVLEILERRNDD